MEIFGIRLRFHWTFILLVAVMFLTSGYSSLNWIVVIFGSVLFHEVAHGLVAKAHHIEVDDITLLPIGGMARLAEMPEDGSIEFQVAAAGPALSLAVSGLLWVLIDAHILPGSRLIMTPAGIERVHTWWSITRDVNFVLGIFNLLPAFPMDGGRIVRALAARKLDYVRATRLAARIGRWIAYVMAGMGIMSFFVSDLPWASQGWWLIIIAVFIFISGFREEMAVVSRHSPNLLLRILSGGAWSSGSPRQPAGPEYPDAIDVEGRVKPGTEKDAADAFRQLSDEAGSHLRD